jgi:hypothetical protein
MEVRDQFQVSAALHPRNELLDWVGLTAGLDLAAKERILVAASD